MSVSIRHGDVIDIFAFSNFEFESNVVVWIQGEDCKQTPSHKTNISPKNKMEEEHFDFGMNFGTDNTVESL